LIALLIIIYISFISLGLPDSLLGSAWPVIQKDFAIPFSIAGYISMVVCFGTVVSSLLANRLIAKFGTGKITFVSVAMTAVALYGYSIAQNVYMLFLMAIPLGLGAGCVDAALNNFVALHYESKHMNWLHCFWGVGATIGPAIMSIFLVTQGGWHKGYFTISAIQSVLVIILFISLPLWKRVEKHHINKSEKEKHVIKNREALKIPYVKLALISFMFLCATESIMITWTSTYLVMGKNLIPNIAAKWVALFYFGMTFGRLISGFLSIKIKSHELIRIGQIICILGTILIMLPIHKYFILSGVILIGLGLAPIYPTTIHETPNRFGSTASGAVIGLQMAFAYIGSTFVPPLFGAIAGVTTIKIFPYALLITIIIMLFTSELLQKKIYNRDKTKSS